MKKTFHLFIMAMLLIGSGNVLHAQPTQVSALDGRATPKNALSRQYTDEECIYYFDDGTDHYFVLQNVGDPDNAIIASFPSFLELHDFEIYQDIIYFCGKFPNTGNPYGIVGFIKVHELFYNNGPYNMSIVNYLYFGTIYSNTHMTSCDRMDLFEDNTGIVHMAIVGELAHSPSYYELRRTFADIWFDGTNWIGNVMYHKDDLYKPTDITCTDNAVVVSAYDELHRGTILLVYKKAAHFPCLPFYSYAIKIDDPTLIEDNVLIERLREDDVVVTNLFKDPATGDYGTALHYIQDVTSLPSTGNFQSYHIIHGMPYAPQIDFRYNKEEDRLLLLHDIDYPQLGLSTQTFFSFDGYNLPSLTMEAWFRPDMDIKMMSIDNRQIYSRLTIGGIFNPTAEPLMVLKDSPTQGCYDFIHDSYIPLLPNFYPGTMDEPYMDYYNSNINIYPYTQENPIIRYCE